MEVTLFEMPSAQKVKAAAYFRSFSPLLSLVWDLQSTNQNVKVKDLVIGSGLGPIGCLAFAILFSKTHDLEDPSELHAEKTAAFVRT